MQKLELVRSVICPLEGIYLVTESPTDKLPPPLILSVNPYARSGDDPVPLVIPIVLVLNPSGAVIVAGSS